MQNHTLHAAAFKQLAPAVCTYNACMLNFYCAAHILHMSTVIKNKSKTPAYVSRILQASNLSDFLKPKYSHMHDTKKDSFTSANDGSVAMVLIAFLVLKFAIWIRKLLDISDSELSVVI